MGERRTKGLAGLLVGMELYPVRALVTNVGVIITISGLVQKAIIRKLEINPAE
jgi:hypothetical protein